MNSKRVAIFIDNSNVFRHILDIRKADKNWNCLYNPLILGEKLAGERNLVFIGFYCVRPPYYLLKGNNEQKKRYNITQRYYNEIEKIQPDILKVKYGYLVEVNGGKPQEKNVDTQLSTDMVAMAALNEYDVAILISNDGDYKSAVENTKKFNKKIENVFFKGTLSMALDGICDIKRKARRSFFVKIEGLEEF